MNCKEEKCEAPVAFLYYAPGHKLTAVCDPHMRIAKEILDRVGFHADFVSIEDFDDSLVVIPYGPEMFGLEEGEVESPDACCNHVCVIPCFDEGKVAYYQCRCGEYVAETPPG